MGLFPRPWLSNPRASGLAPKQFDDELFAQYDQHLDSEHLASVVPAVVCAETLAAPRFQTYETPRAELAGY